MTLDRIQKALAILVGAFVFYTAATGPFEGLIQRALFLALVSSLGFALYPLGEGTSWRRIGLIVDLALGAVTLAACAYVVVNYDAIMTTLPWATTLDKALTFGLVLSVLELGRRTVGLIFPALVVAGIGYALFGNLLPGALRHRGFDTAFVTETIFLGDLGIWGMLTGVAATVIAAFVLFGALLLHTGGGQAFMDLAMRLGGRQPGGAERLASTARQTASTRVNTARQVNASKDSVSVRRPRARARSRAASRSATKRPSSSPPTGSPSPTATRA